MRDFGLEAQRAAEEHLSACEAWLWQAEEDIVFAPSPASAPFCGCDTCQVREILFVAWPILLQAAKEELAADGVDPEQEDEPERDGDGDQGEVTGSECHVVKLPRRSDVQA